MENREIKFRGKRVDNGKWVYGSLDIAYDGTMSISFWYSKMIEPENNHKEMAQEWHEVIPESAGQFTGLTDNKRTPEYPNGQDIYEGDVDDRNLCIKLNNLHNCWAWFKNTGMYSQILSNIHDEKGEYIYPHIGTKIIGNIHNNPELLNQTP